MNTATWAVHDILELLLECGRIGLHHFQNSEWWLKPDRTLVTPADGEIEALLAKQFDHPEKGCWMLGEETVADHGEDYLQAMLKGRTWIVDPIDGTAPFAHKLAYWGTSIGLMENGTLLEGAVILPQQGELFISNNGNVYFAENVDVYGTAEQVDLCLLAPKPRSLNDGSMIALSQVLAKGGRFDRPNPVQVTGCAVNSLVYLMLGRYLAYFGHMKLWDVAGALPMLAKTGFQATHLDGTPMSLKVDNLNYDLDAGSPRRWCVRNGAVFAPAGMAASLLPSVRLTP